jgi:hypothetical protein
VYILNCVFAWLWVALCVAGYHFGYRSFGAKWRAWFFLATGWLSLAVAQTLFVLNLNLDLASIVVLWLFSYAMIMCSTVLLFIKVIRFKKMNGNNADGR